MNKIFFCLFFFAFLAFGQRAEKLDRAAATHAWDMAMSLPSDTPQISKGGLVVETETNGIGRKVWLVTTQPGTYLIKGRNCSGEETKLGQLSWETNPDIPSVTIQILDTVGMQMAAPFMEQPCSVDVMYVAGGKIEKSSVGVNPWAGEVPSVRVGSEGFTQEGQYYLATYWQIPVEATAILGRNLVATEIRNAPGGTGLILFPNGGMPPVGPTTLTVCWKGQCSSIVFERKIAVGVTSPEKG